MLNLADNTLDLLGARSLAQSKLPRLSTLRLVFDIPVYKGDIVTEITQASWPMMQNLDAIKTYLTAEGLLAIKNARWPLLLSIDLTGNDISGKLSALCGANWPQLQSLSLNWCQLKD